MPANAKTLTRSNALLADLKAARKAGVAFDREEHTLGICAAGVALHDPLGNAVGISVPVPTHRFHRPADADRRKTARHQTRAGGAYAFRRRLRSRLHTATDAHSKQKRKKKERRRDNKNSRISISKKILNNSMGLEFVNLSHRFGYQSPNWPYFEDVKIERIHYMAKSGVLSQRITTSMHNTTHIDAPAHVIQGTPFIDEVPLPHFFGSGIVVSIPKKNGK